MSSPFLPGPGTSPAVPAAPISTIPILPVFTTPGPEESGLQIWEGLYFNPTTGEAIIKFNPPEIQPGDEDNPLSRRLRHDPIWWSTGWYFDAVTQQQPIGTVPISPWNHLSYDSVLRLADMLKTMVPGSWQYQGIGMEDQNFQYPQSRRALELHWADVSKNHLPIRINAGAYVSSVLHTGSGIDDVGHAVHYDWVKTLESFISTL